MPAEKVMFPDEMLELQSEIKHHPILMEALKELQGYNFSFQLAAVATYCDVLLDGDYSTQDILKIAERLTRKLQDKRAGHVITIH